MVQKLSYVYVNDNTLVVWFRVFHTYGGFSRKVSFVNDYVKGSAQVIKPAQQEYKGFKVKSAQKGAIGRLVLVKSRWSVHSRFGQTLSMNGNTGITIKKNRILKGKYIYGTTSYLLTQRRFRSMFKVVF